MKHFKDAVKKQSITEQQTNLINDFITENKIEELKKTIIDHPSLSGALDLVPQLDKLKEISEDNPNTESCKTALLQIHLATTRGTYITEILQKQIQNLEKSKPIIKSNN